MMLSPDSTETDKSLDRVDGRLKVTGSAMYSAEYQFDSLVYAVLVTSTIARGRIRNIITATAEEAPGVLAVISHLNTPGVPGYGKPRMPAERAPVGTAFRVFYDDLIYFNG